MGNNPEKIGWLHVVGIKTGHALHLSICREPEYDVAHLFLLS